MLKLARYNWRPPSCDDEKQRRTENKNVGRLMVSIASRHCSPSSIVALCHFSCNRRTMWGCSNALRQRSFAPCWTCAFPAQYWGEHGRKVTKGNWGLWNGNGGCGCFRTCAGRSWQNGGRLGFGRENGKGRWFACFLSWRRALNLLWWWPTYFHHLAPPNRNLAHRSHHWLSYFCCSRKGRCHILRKLWQFRCRDNKGTSQIRGHKFMSGAVLESLSPSNGSLHSSQTVPDYFSSPGSRSTMIHLPPLEMAEMKFVS